MKLDLYIEEFESFLLVETEKFYTNKAELWQRDMSCNEYIVEIDRYHQKEEANSELFYQERTKKLIIDITLDTAVVR